MPHPFFQHNRLAFAYGILVIVVAIAFFEVGTRITNEGNSRRSSDTAQVKASNALLLNICQQAAEGRVAGNVRGLVLRDFIAEAVTARHANALLDRANGDPDRAAIDQAAADHYQALFDRVIILPPPVPCK